MPNKQEEVEVAKRKVLSIFPEAYAWDTKRGGFDIIDVIDKDRAMAIGYGKNEESAWVDAASRQQLITSAPEEPQEGFEECGVCGALMRADASSISGFRHIHGDVRCLANAARAAKEAKDAK